MHSTGLVQGQATAAATMIRIWKDMPECTKAALAYSAQIAPEIPADPTDIKVDMIVTEEELILCSQDFRETR